MKLRKFLYGLTLMLGCFVFAACVSDEEGPCLPKGKTEVVFSLFLQENTKAATRAGDETWNNYDPKDTGVEYDNYIDLDNVQMLLFDTSDKYVGTLSDMTHFKTGENVYQYLGTAPSEIAAGDYKFVVLANCDAAGLTANSTIADLDDLTYDLLAESGNSEYIPMWGVLKATLTLIAGNRQEIGTIHLLRAVSKVTVKLEAQEGATGNPLRDYSLKKVAISNYNKSGYVTPTGAATAETTTELNLDASLHAYASAGTNKEFAVAATGDTELTFYLPEFDNANADTPAVLTVYLTKTVGEGESATTINFDAPIQFCDYFTSGDNKGKPDTSKPYNIIRNHNYQFQIYSVSDDGALYVKPTVADWIDTEELTYPIDMSTSMRLFDSWLYRYDTDGQYGWSDGGYDHWNESHMVVSSGRGTATTAEPVAGRPLHSPQIQLVTTASAGSFELYIDNEDFEIVKANKNETGVVTSYTTSSDGTLTIAAGEDVYTYFYIVPKEEVTPSNPVAKVFLYYNDTALGKLEMPFNYGSLPGYSDDSSEIWAYYVSEDAYEAGQIDDDNKFMRMYYQDVKNPLVPVE
ncbi:MAG: FimB/Mfa2 family fimbrial subunit [Bacteroidales bacterium]|nr:FimB/Mfa2 family fimbrial subunit [Bacteroidales bacterium]